MDEIAPEKRPFHTIIPGFLNLVDRGVNPQAALDAPRWRFDRGNRVYLEQMVPCHMEMPTTDTINRRWAG